MPELVSGLALIRLLARGGFAEVWEAEQVSLGRRVAVKVLRHEHLGQEQMVQLFEQEARVLARLNHPNLVQVIDRGTSPAGPYFVMEYVEGETLQEMLTQGKLSRDRALAILMQSARGLAYAHRNKVIHRDIKPANILVSRGGQVKLSDFGIAAVRRAATEGGDEDTGPTHKTALGTRAFMAPEQRVSFDSVGPQADVYSLGVVLHRIVTGKLPQAPGVPRRDLEIPSRLLPIVERALALEADTRFPDAGAFREALVNALEGRHLDDRARRGAATAIGAQGRFELLDVIRQDELRSVYLVRKGGPTGERIVVKRYRRDPEALRTIRQLVRVEHPNIVRIHAVGEREDAFIMVMEHMAGGDLRERLVQPHPWHEVARVGAAVAAALAVSSRHGIVHGNLRPSNILFDSRGEIRVADFGLPEHYRGEEGKRNWYAAPEESRSAQADLYALGAILYEMLFAMPVPAGTADPMAETTSRGDVPPRMVAVLRRLLAPLPARYQKAQHAAEEFREMLKDAPDRSSEAAAHAAASPAATCQSAAAAPPSVAYGPALVGLGGLILVWMLQWSSVQAFLVDLFAGR